jgi:ABC-type multidrug transport system fused ATPase/permease subunit
MRNLKDFIYFIGFKVAFFVLLTIFLSVSLSLIELSIAVFIQAFLVTLGLINEKVEIFGLTIPNLGLDSIIIFLLFIGLFRFLIQLISSQSSIFINEIMNARLRSLCLYDLFSKNLTQCNDISQINYRMTEVFPKATSFVNNTVFLTNAILQSLSIMLIMFITLWKESLISLIGIFVIGSIILYVNRKMRKIAVQIPSEYSKLASTIERVFKNIVFLNIMRIKDIEFKKVMENLLNYESKSLRISFLNSLASTLAPFLGIILLVCTIFISINIWKTQSLQLIAFLYLFVRFVQNISSTSNLYGSLNIVRPQYKLGLEYFSKFSFEIKSKLYHDVHKLKFIGSNKNCTYDTPFFNQSALILNTENAILPSIEFNQVSFHYPNEKIKVLNDFSMIVPNGTQLGIIGASGAGKTTVLMLLFGLLNPNKGRVLIDSKTPYDFFNNPNNRVGYVGVEPFLIKGTIRENLLYGIKFSVQEKEIWECLSLVKLERFVEKVGLDYLIQEDQSGLSAGQKQRLCLARAFLNKPTLLILDEATANLDEKTELEVANALEFSKQKCTTVIVSHRKGIIKYVDNLLELKYD